MSKQQKEVTKQEILEAIVLFSSQIDEKISKMATKKDLKQFATKKDLEKFATKKDLKKFATKDDLKALESRMVSKSYLDDKLASLQADLAIDKKIKTLTNILQHKQVINSKEANTVFSV